MSVDGYLLGYDIGSSSVKATVLEISTDTLLRQLLHQIPANWK